MCDFLHFQGWLHQWVAADSMHGTIDASLCRGCRRWHTVSNEANVNPFPGPYLNAHSVLRLRPVTNGCQTLMELETEFLTDPAQAVSLASHATTHASSRDSSMPLVRHSILAQRGVELESASACLEKFILFPTGQHCHNPNVHVISLLASACVCWVRALDIEILALFKVIWTCSIIAKLWSP